MPAPEISVILVDLHGDLRETLRALAPQAQLERVEVVIVTADGDPEPLAARYPELGGLRHWRVAGVGDTASAAAALAAGVRTATGRVVAYCEDHVLPDPGWIEARLAAHAEGASVVGGVLRNANPGSAVSWATFLRSFGPFAVPVAGGRSSQLPWHQCSYRREALPDGPELEPLLENEGLLHADLMAHGHELMLEASCGAAHLNPSRWGSLLTSSWEGGRAWGAGRAAHEGWSAATRARHCLLFPHTVGHELRARLADLRRVAPPRWRRVLPALALATLTHAAGEAFGLWAGAGPAAGRLANIELNRRAHLRPGETLSAP